jgi:pyoverdine/dityrosine biosynthesis protein Dit1
MNIGSSPYHAIGALYCRGFDAELLSIEGRCATQIADKWTDLRKLMVTGSQSWTTLRSGIIVNTTIIDSPTVQSYDICAAPGSHSHVIRELQRPNESHHVGLISCAPEEDKNDNIAFREWLETFVLIETSLQPGRDKKSRENADILRITATISNLFDTTLRNIASNDEWSVGKAIFERRVLDFVARGERIQMAVPAFPCKSPSDRKVGGVVPDMAEYVALQTLHRFATDVKTIYPPGAAMWIVSDGHVFSDCSKYIASLLFLSTVLSICLHLKVGVDDEVVCKYDQNLLETYQRMFKSPEDHQAVRFRGLTEMFFSNSDAQFAFNNDWSDHFHIAHPIHSKHVPEAELARNIMMTGFQSSKEHFRKLIAEQHPSTLSLYRGQARFMQDDLSCPSYLAMSVKQRKKRSFAVAAEMIARNQAYSNLLELLLPNYVRLSIHAHSNRGPKFGICLLPRSRVRAIDSVVDRHELCASYEFQVPTPWHNSMIKIKGDDMLYLGKAEIVQKAVYTGEFEGEWVDDQASGGHFALRPTPAISSAISVDTESASTVSTNFVDEKQSAMVNTDAVEVLVIDSPLDATKGRLAVRLRGKVYRMLELSRLFVERVTKERGGLQTLQSGQRGVAMTSH